MASGKLNMQQDVPVNAGALFVSQNSYLSVNFVLVSAQNMERDGKH